MIGNILKPKTDEEIQEALEEMSPEQLLKVGAKWEDREIIRLGIEKADTNVFAMGYSPRHINASNPINLNTFYEVLDVNERYVTTRRIYDGDEDDFTLGFFGDRFTPIYKDNIDLYGTKQTIDKIMNAI